LVNECIWWIRDVMCYV